MTNIQFYLAIGVPSFIALTGIMINVTFFTLLAGRLDRIQADLSQFYRDLGRHDEAIENLKEQMKGRS